MLNPHSPSTYISTTFAKNNAIQTANSKLYDHLPKRFPTDSLSAPRNYLTRLKAQLQGLRRQQGRARLFQNSTPQIRADE
jgi:hypothetical protein